MQGKYNNKVMYNIKKFQPHRTRFRLAFALSLPRLLKRRQAKGRRFE